MENAYLATQIAKNVAMDNMMDALNVLKIVQDPHVYVPMVILI